MTNAVSRDDPATLVLKGGVLFIVLCVWLVVGFVFWIPLLARETASFSVAAVQANLVSNRARLSNARLRHATSFYINGFRSIVDAVFATEDQEETGSSFRFWRFLIETLWTIIFWWFTLFFLAHLVGGHLEGQPWITNPVDWVSDKVESAWSSIQRMRFGQAQGE